MEKRRILFICVQNSFRSQIAETFMNEKYGDKFEAESAGFSQKEVSPLAIKVMAEKGMNISENKANSVFEYYKQNRNYEYVITVCNKKLEEQCPVFPGVVRRINWNLENPEDFEGTDEEKLTKAIALRNEIECRIDDFVHNLV